MNLTSVLDQMGVKYRCSEHPTTYTSQDLAAVEHVPGRRVVKPVIVEADGKPVMCVLPATSRIHLQELRRELRAEDAHLVEEQRLAQLCPECELGAEPPIGSLFGMPTYMDESLMSAPTVTFQAGTHRSAITMDFADYFRVAQPTVGHFGIAPRQAH